MLYFSEPIEEVKIQESSKSFLRYYTFDRPVRDLLSNIKIMNSLVMRARGDKDEYKYRGIFVLVSRVICTLLSGV